MILLLFDLFILCCCCCLIFAGKQSLSPPLSVTSVLWLQPKHSRHIATIFYRQLKVLFSWSLILFWRMYFQRQHKTDCSFQVSLKLRRMSHYWMPSRQESWSPLGCFTCSFPSSREMQHCRNLLREWWIPIVSRWVDSNGHVDRCMCTIITVYVSLMHILMWPMPSLLHLPTQNILQLIETGNRN